MGADSSTIEMAASGFEAITDDAELLFRGFLMSALTALYLPN